MAKTLVKLTHEQISTIEVEFGVKELPELRTGMPRTYQTAIYISWKKWAEIKSHPAFVPIEVDL